MDHKNQDHFVQCEDFEAPQDNLANNVHFYDNRIGKLPLIILSKHLLGKRRNCGFWQVNKSDSILKWNEYSEEKSQSTFNCQVTVKDAILESLRRLVSRDLAVWMQLQWEEEIKNRQITVDQIETLTPFMVDCLMLQPNMIEILFSLLFGCCIPQQKNFSYKKLRCAEIYSYALSIAWHKLLSHYKVLSDPKVQYDALVNLDISKETGQYVHRNWFLSAIYLLNVGKTQAREQKLQGSVEYLNLTIHEEALRYIRSRSKNSTELFKDYNHDELSSPRVFFPNYRTFTNNESRSKITICNIGKILVADEETKKPFFGWFGVDRLNKVMVRHRYYCLQRPREQAWFVQIGKQSKPLKTLRGPLPVSLHALTGESKAYRQVIALLSEEIKTKMLDKVLGKSQPLAFGDVNQPIGENEIMRVLMTKSFYRISLKHNNGANYEPEKDQVNDQMQERPFFLKKCEPTRWSALKAQVDAGKLLNAINLSQAVNDGYITSELLYAQGEDHESVQLDNQVVATTMLKEPKRNTVPYNSSLGFIYALNTLLGNVFFTSEKDFVKQMYPKRDELLLYIKYGGMPIEYTKLGVYQLMLNEPQLNEKQLYALLFDGMAAQMIFSQSIKQSSALFCVYYDGGQHQNPDGQNMQTIPVRLQSDGQWAYLDQESLVWELIGCEPVFFGTESCFGKAIRRFGIPIASRIFILNSQRQPFAEDLKFNSTVASECILRRLRDNEKLIADFDVNQLADGQYDSTFDLNQGKQDSRQARGFKKKQGRKFAQIDEYKPPTVQLGVPKKSDGKNLRAIKPIRASSLPIVSGCLPEQINSNQPPNRRESSISDMTSSRATILEHWAQNPDKQLRAADVAIAKTQMKVTVLVECHSKCSICEVGTADFVCQLKSNQEVTHYICAACQRSQSLEAACACRPDIIRKIIEEQYKLNENVQSFMDQICANIQQEVPATLQLAARQQIRIQRSANEALNSYNNIRDRSLIGQVGSVQQQSMQPQQRIITKAKKSTVINNVEQEVDNEEEEVEDEDNDKEEDEQDEEEQVEDEQVDVEYDEEERKSFKNDEGFYSKNTSEDDQNSQSENLNDEQEEQNDFRDDQVKKPSTQILQSSQPDSQPKASNSQKTILDLDQETFALENNRTLMQGVSIAPNTLEQNITNKRIVRETNRRQTRRNQNQNLVVAPNDDDTQQISQARDTKLDTKAQQIRKVAVGRLQSNNKQDQPATNHATQQNQLTDSNQVKTSHSKTSNEKSALPSENVSYGAKNNKNVQESVYIGHLVKSQRERKAKTAQYSPRQSSQSSSVNRKAQSVFQTHYLSSAQAQSQSNQSGSNQKTNQKKH